MMHLTIANLLARENLLEVTRAKELHAALMKMQLADLIGQAGV